MVFKLGLGICISKWKDATVKFGIHESSKCHKRLAKQKCGLILISTSNEEKVQTVVVFSKILSNVRFLACKGLPLRGHGDDESDSNFMQLLKLRGKDDSKIESWLQKKTAPGMQNELLKTIARSNDPKFTTIIVLMLLSIAWS